MVDTADVKLSLRVMGALAAQIGARGDVSSAVRSGLERYYYWMDAALRSLAGQFSEGEQALLADVNNGTYWEPATLALLSANVEDAELEYFAKWGADRDVMIEKLRGLTELQTAAVVDAIERFWHAVGQRELRDPRKLLNQRDDES
jgi:hypothetical protein